MEKGKDKEMRELKEAMAFMKKDTDKKMIELATRIGSIQDLEKAIKIKKGEGK